MTKNWKKLNCPDSLFIRIPLKHRIAKHFLKLVNVWALLQLDIETVP